MRKVSVLIAIILVISMPLTAFAAPRALGINPTLAFDGVTATCDVMVVGNNTSEYIEVTMKLMEGSYCVASWYDTGYGYVWLQEDVIVIRKHTYDLVVEVKVNGVASTPVSVSGTC